MFSDLNIFYNNNTVFRYSYRQICCFVLLQSNGLQLSRGSRLCLSYNWIWGGAPLQLLLQHKFQGRLQGPGLLAVDLLLLHPHLLFHNRSRSLTEEGTSSQKVPRNQLKKSCMVHGWLVVIPHPASLVIRSGPLTKIWMERF